METYAEPGGSEIDTGAILTTNANADIAHIHDRMPVVIQPEDFARWLDCRSQRAARRGRPDAAAGAGFLRGDPGLRQRQQGRQHRAGHAGSGRRSRRRIGRSRRREDSKPVSRKLLQLALF